MFKKTTHTLSINRGSVFIVGAKMYLKRLTNAGHGHSHPLAKRGHPRPL